MNNVMLDIETMGNTPSSAIVSIGAVKFNENGIGDEFYVNVSLESSVKHGGVIDPSTLLWWMDQSKDAQQSFKNNTLHINVALQEFSAFLGDDNKKIWGCGSTFDNVIMESAYRNSGLPIPWKFWNNMCYRIMKTILPYVEVERIGTHHNALDDAKTQAIHLINIFKTINIK